MEGGYKKKKPFYWGGEGAIKEVTRLGSPVSGGHGGSLKSTVVLTRSPKCFQIIDNG